MTAVTACSSASVLKANWEQRDFKRISRGFQREAGGLTIDVKPFYAATENSADPSSKHVRR
jgi:hypothetical protein